MFFSNLLIFFRFMVTVKRLCWFFLQNLFLVFLLKRFISFPIFSICSFFIFPNIELRTVHKNLRQAFPEKSEKYISDVARQFYRHLSDLSLEVIKAHKMSAEEFKERCSILGADALEAVSKGRSRASHSVNHTSGKLGVDAPCRFATSWCAY